MSNIYFVMVVSYFYMTFSHFLVYWFLFFCFSLFYRDYTVVRGVMDFFFGVET